MQTNGLVVTTINPFSNLQHQICCFEAWKKLGFRVMTINVSEEADRLMSAGIQKVDIHIIDICLTGQALFGKPVPKIIPILYLLAEDVEAEYFLITNADIFPAVRSSRITKFWELTNSCLALTREECHSLGTYGYTSNNPYRGGLDTFFMTKPSLLDVLRRLESLKASERMAFGVPGWDYLMAATMLSPEIGGAIMDSGFLLHVTHRANYGNVDELAKYIPDLSHLNMLIEMEPTKAAHEFASRIYFECQNNIDLTRFAKLLYFCPLPKQIIDENYVSVSNIIINHLYSIAPNFINAYRPSSYITLAQRMMEEPHATLEMANTVFVDSPSQCFRFLQTLFAIAFCLRCKSYSSLSEIREYYPKGNQHVAAMSNIMNTYSEGTAERRSAIAALFGAELINYNIFNRYLYNYLVLSCENDAERGLMKEISSLITKENRNAAGIS